MARINEKICQGLSEEERDSAQTIMIKKGDEVLCFSIEEIKQKIERDKWFIQSSVQIEEMDDQKVSVLNIKKKQPGSFVILFGNFGLNNRFIELFNEGFNTFEADDNKEIYIYKSRNEFNVKINLYSVSSIPRCKIYNLKETECSVPMKWKIEEKKEKEEKVDNDQFLKKCVNLIDIETTDWALTDNIVIFKIEDKNNFYCADQNTLKIILKCDPDAKDTDNKPVIEQIVTTEGHGNKAYLESLQIDRDFWIYKIPYLEAWVNNSLISALEKKCNTILLIPLRLSLTYRSSSQSGMHDMPGTIYKADCVKRNDILPEIKSVRSKFTFHLDLHKNKNLGNRQKLDDVKKIIKDIKQEKYLSNGKYDLLLPDYYRLIEVYIDLVLSQFLNRDDVPIYVFTEKVCLELVEKTGSNLQFIPISKITKNLVKKAIKNCDKDFKLSNYIPESVYDDEIISLLIEKNPRWVLNFPESVVDEKVIIQALEKDGRLIKKIKNGRTNEMIITALKTFPEFIFDLELTTPEMQSVAFSSDKLILKDFEESALTKKIVNIAIENNPLAIQFVPEKFLTNDLIIKALFKDPSVLKLVDQKFVSDKVVDYYVNETKNWSLEFIPIEKRTEEICKKAFDNNVKQIDFIPETILDKLGIEKLKN